MTFIKSLTCKTFFLQICYFFEFFHLLSQRTMKMTILTSIWGAQHQRAGQYIQHSSKRKMWKKLQKKVIAHGLNYSWLAKKVYITIKIGVEIEIIKQVSCFQLIRNYLVSRCSIFSFVALPFFVKLRFLWLQRTLFFCKVLKLIYVKVGWFCSWGL